MTNKELQIHNLQMMRAKIANNKTFYKHFWKLYDRTFDHRPLRMILDLALLAGFGYLGINTLPPLRYILCGIALLFLGRFYVLWKAKGDFMIFFRKNIQMFGQNMGELLDLSMGLSGYFWDVRLLEKLIRLLSDPKATDLRSVLTKNYPRQMKGMPMSRDLVRKNVNAVAEKVNVQIAADARRNQRKALGKVAAMSALAGLFAQSGEPINWEAEKQKINAFEQQMEKDKQERLARQAEWNAAEKKKADEMDRARRAREEAAQKAHYAGYMADHSTPGSLQQQQFESDYDYWSERARKK